MTLADRLRRIVSAMPAGASVTLPVSELRGWIEEDGQPFDDSQEIVIDLTVEQIAEQFDRTPACVRGWCRAGRLPGAYRLNRREWRIPRAALAAYLEAERDRPTASSSPRRAGGSDLGAWRRDGGAS